MTSSVSAGHGIVACEGCGAVISQCRCMDHNHVTRRGFCDACAKKPKHCICNGDVAWKPGDPAKCPTCGKRARPPGPPDPPIPATSVPRNAAPSLLDEIERLTRERDEAIKALELSHFVSRDKLGALRMLRDERDEARAEVARLRGLT